MTSALSNPYELTVGGITCKSSPFDNGYYVSNEDIDKLGEVNSKKFKNALFDLYDVEQSRELKGIKVYGLRKNGNAISADMEKNHG